MTSYLGTATDRDSQRFRAGHPDWMGTLQFVDRRPINLDTMPGPYRHAPWEPNQHELSMEDRGDPHDQPYYSGEVSSIELSNWTMMDDTVVSTGTFTAADTAMFHHQMKLFI